MARPTKLNKQLQNKLVRVLKTGVSVTDACRHVGIHKDTFYEWLKRGQNDEAIFADFSDAITRALGDAKVTAVGTLRSAMTPYTQTAKTTETYIETRLTRQGTPYDYKRQTESQTVTVFPGDWRAAVEYLKRRYPDEWSEKRILELGLSDELLKKLEQVAKQADIPASQLFEEMLNELAAQLQEGGAADAGESAGGDG